jgi:hypothetical protein
MMIAIGNKKDDRWHLQMAQRWVVQYNFYVNDEHWGRMFVRMCPYLPFSARVCLNQHHWLAIRMRQEGIDFQQCTNAFLKCANPARLQELADSLTARDLLNCGQKWLATFTPFFTERERKQAGCQHRLFFAQVELCDNLIFHRRAALDQMGERLLDANRTIGQPNKITVIFGRKITKQYRGKLQTVIEDMDLPNPVIRSHYGNGFVKQYVRDHLLLRTEPASNNVNDYRCKKAIENLPQLRENMSSVIDTYHNVQQDILETFIDSGATAQTLPADDSAEWQAHSWPETGSSPATGPDARPGPLQPHRRAKHFHNRGDLFRYSVGSGSFPHTIQLGFSSIRPLQASRQRTRGKSPALAPLSPAPRGLFHLPRLLEAV